MHPHPLRIRPPGLPPPHRRRIIQRPAVAAVAATAAAVAATAATAAAAAAVAMTVLAAAAMGTAIYLRRRLLSEM